ncbi:MAG: hypothetical protein WCH75_31455 [Candidatus Binatia bacterium]
MKLREHPLITYRGLRSWPPVWTWVGGTDNSHPTGELGILKEVKPSKIEPADRMFLYMDHENGSYLGCLLVENSAFCSQVVTLLQSYSGRPIREIGDLDLSYML